MRVLYQLSSDSTFRAAHVPAAHFRQLYKETSVSEFKTSTFKVNGDRVTFGDNSGNTTVSNVRVTNHARSGGGQSPEASDGLAVPFAVFAGAVFVAWLYLKHFDMVHFALRAGYLLSVMPVLLTVAISAVRGDGATSKVVLNGLPVGMVTIVAFVLIAGFDDRISPEVLSFAQRVNPAEMWKGLPDYWRRVVLESEGAVIAVAMTLLVNWLVALRLLITQTLSPDNLLSRMTARYTPTFGATFGAGFLALSWGLSSGRAYEAWIALQAALMAAAH
jgi:hypothetical protein